ncbi:CPBP family intramembrane glutamic endopeptidase [Streptomyces sp. ISL-11]|uniref:CPBP family intramembrane glutamic endopeptidase n=1 Tax=Streptomyces sp. ISL-11 TaxID=2819174 RepID=UPI001BEC21A9|nr:CPBP family intramembrane glutamic endopeptidase [Streptomyces sp. ISL-11]MBT2385284.1 CPBP family intramembrane metalloprotease [Streptomyces sp. ISL-11]
MPHSSPHPRPYPTGRPSATRDWCLIIAGFLLAFGLATICAVQILLTGGIDLPAWTVRYLPGMKAGFIVAAAALLLARWWLGHRTADLGLALRTRRPFPYGGLGATAVAYLGMWVGFEVMRLFPAPDYTPAHRSSAGDQFVANLHSALVEETLLLALPMAVMTRLRWCWQAQLAVLVALRVPFHLYYGYGALALGLVWMCGYVLVYRQVGVVWPSMLTHFAYNSAHADYLPPTARSLMGFALLVGGVATLVRLARRTAPLPLNRRRPLPTARGATPWPSHVHDGAPRRAGRD